MGTPNWKKIRADYIKGGITYAELAKKHNVPYGTLKNRAQSEKWGKAREEVEEKAGKKATDDIANLKANIDTRSVAILSKLFEELEKVVKNQEVFTVGEIRDAADTLKKLKECGGKSDLDIEEQRERINKLRREAQQIGADEDDDNTGVLMLPNADAPLIDKEESDA